MHAVRKSTAVEANPPPELRIYKIQYVAIDSQPEGWTVFVDTLPVIVVDSPKEALALASEMAERDHVASGHVTLVVVQPGGHQDPIWVQDFGMP